LRSVLEGEFVGLGGDLTFLRTAFLNAYYLPLWSKGYMRYRGDFRFLAPMGKTDDFKDIPLSERFFLGGVASVRGYKDFIIGHLFDKTNKAGETKTSSDPTGGISSSFLSLEYIQQIFPFLDAFAFIDAGCVSDKRFTLGTYRMSYGIGATLEV